MPKKRRRGWVRGDWLVQDEESGFTTYGKSVGRDYYGVLKVKNQMDAAHPQMFIRAKNDPFVMTPLHPPFRNYADACDSNQGFFVNNSNVPVLPSPAGSLFRPGIGDAIIGCNFYVY